MADFTIEKTERTKTAAKDHVDRKSTVAANRMSLVAPGRGTSCVLCEDGVPEQSQSPDNNVANMNSFLCSVNATVDEENIGKFALDVDQASGVGIVPPESKYKCLTCEDEESDAERIVNNKPPNQQQQVASSQQETLPSSDKDEGLAPTDDPKPFLPNLKETVLDLQSRFDAVLARNKELEASVAELVQKEGDLEVIVDHQTQQISAVDERQSEQERVLLAPMRNIYFRQFHDQVREGISKKLAGSSVYERHFGALKQRVHQHEQGIRDSLVQVEEDGDLWQFIQEAAAVAPKFFCKGNLWNKFVDEVLQDQELVVKLGLSPAALELTRYKRPPPERPRAANPLNVPSGGQDVHLRNKLVFAEVVAGQNDAARPLYAELYEFFYKVPPETMYIKGEPDLPGQPIHAPDLPEEVLP